MAISLKNNLKRIKAYYGKIRPDIRFLDDMRDILYDRKWAKKAPNFPLYYMYRGVKKKGDLRYDITVIPPRMLGQEFPKTKGHEHSKKYQEFYIVLEGKAIYLIQRYKNNKIDDIYAVEAKKGEAVIIPSYYGHITINPLKNKLIEANWLNKKCQNIYNIFEKNKGACYYYTKSGWVKNKNYEFRSNKKIPKLRFEKSLKSLPKKLYFLKA